MIYNEQTFTRRFFYGKLFSLTIFCLLSVNCAVNNGQTTAENAQTSKLEVPKIYVGENFLQKKEIFRYKKTKTENVIVTGIGVTLGDKRPPKIDRDELELNRIVGVYAGEIDDEKGTDILAAGGTKAFVLDAQGKVKKEINYNLGTYFDGSLTQIQHLPFISFADADNDGKIEIIGHRTRIGVIINLKGQTLWKYKITEEYKYLDAIVVTDIDGDGKNEIAVAVKNRLEVYDFASKKMKWSANFAEATYQSLSYGKLQIADFSGDGSREILAGNTLLDTNGKVIKKFDNFYYWTGILNQKNKTPVFLGFKDNKLNFTEMDKTLIGSYEAPLSSLKRKPRYSASNGYRLFSLQAVPVKLFNNDSKYLVVLASANDEEEFESFKMLYVYDSIGMLVYQETIEAFNSEIGIFPNADGTESLLITDDGKVNLYTVK